MNRIIFLSIIITKFKIKIFRSQNMKYFTFQIRSLDSYNMSFISLINLIFSFIIKNYFI